MIADLTWMPDYVTRRELILALGYRWHEADAVWCRGRQILTDEQIDRMPIAQLREQVMSPKTRWERLTDSADAVRANGHNGRNDATRW
jgi:hypothetical protein